MTPPDLLGKLLAFGAGLFRRAARRLDRERHARTRRRILRELTRDDCDFQGPVECRHLHLSTALEIVDSELAK